MQTFKIHDSPCKTISLEYITPDDVSGQLNYLQDALKAVFVVAKNLFEPLKVDLQLNFNDVEYEFPVSNEYPSQAFWTLQKKEIPQNIAADSYWAEPQINQVHHINAEAVHSWVAEALASNEDQKPADFTLGWRELLFNTNRCYLPIQQADLTDNCIAIQQGLHTYHFPVISDDHGIWIAGPITPQTLYAPLEVKVANTAGLLELSLSLYWSVYTTPQQMGLRYVKKTIDKLLHLGWTKAFESETLQETENL